MRTLLLAALLIPGTSWGLGGAITQTAEPITGMTITPTAITAVTGSFSGSVTASSVTITGAASSPQMTVRGNGAVAINLNNAAGLTDSITSGGITMISRNTSTGKLTLSTNADDIVLSPAGSVGIGTASPCSTCTLHVAGGASVTGAFAVASATFTVAGGIVSAPSNPYVRAPVGAAVLTNTVSTKLYFGAPAAGDNLASMYGGASSSGTFTVPSGGAGTYALNYHQYPPAVAGSYVTDFKKNGSAISGCYHETTATGSTSVNCPTTIKLAAGDTIEVWINQTGTVNLVPNTNAVYSYFTMKKDDL